MDFEYLVKSYVSKVVSNEDDLEDNELIAFFIERGNSKEESVYVTLFTPIILGRIICESLNINFGDLYFEHLEDGTERKGFLPESKDIATPSLDILAGQSVRCTSGYVSHPFCSPTRAGLLTGRYQQRFGHETNPEWLPESTRSGFPVSEITLPQWLKPQGYVTGLVGKWHLGAHPQFHPLKRGFDECFVALGGGHQYFPAAPNKSEYRLPLDRNGVAEPQKSCLTDQFGDEACGFVSRHAGAPWFLYLAFNAPHTPLQAPHPCRPRLKSSPNSLTSPTPNGATTMPASPASIITSGAFSRN